jgi:hypothetical protein
MAEPHFAPDYVIAAAIQFQSDGCPESGAFLSQWVRHPSSFATAIAIFQHSDIPLTAKFHVTKAILFHVEQGHPDYLCQQAELFSYFQDLFIRPDLEGTSLEGQVYAILAKISVDLHRLPDIDSPTSALRLASAAMRECRLPWAIARHGTPQFVSELNSHVFRLLRETEPTPVWFDVLEQFFQYVPDVDSFVAICPMIEDVINSGGLDCVLSLLVGILYDAVFPAQPSNELAGLAILLTGALVEADRDDLVESLDSLWSTLATLHFDAIDDERLSELVATFTRVVEVLGTDQALEFVMDFAGKLCASVADRRLPDAGEVFLQLAVEQAERGWLWIGREMVCDVYRTSPQLVMEFARQRMEQPTAGLIFMVAEIRDFPDGEIIAELIQYLPMYPSAVLYVINAFPEHLQDNLQLFLENILQIVNGNDVAAFEKAAQCLATLSKSAPEFFESIPYDEISLAICRHIACDIETVCKTSFLYMRTLWEKTHRDQVLMNIQ